MHIKLFRAALAALLMLTLGALSPQPARAAAVTLRWVGPNNGHWSVPANWVNVDGGTSILPDANVTLLFDDPGAGHTAYNDLDVTVAAIQLNTTGMTLTGNPLRVTQSVGSTAAGVTAAINLPLILAPPAPNLTVTFSAAAASVVTISGGISGTGWVNKTGPGTLVLSAPGSYGSAPAIATTVSAGTLALNHPAGAGVHAIQVNDGASLSLSAAIATLDNELYLSGSGMGGLGALTVDATVPHTLRGLIKLNGAATVSSPAPGQVIFNTVITGSGSLSLKGGATYVISGLSANTFNGPLLFSGGELRLEKPANIIAVPGGLTLGPGASASAPDRLTVIHDGQFAPTGLLTLNSNTQLNLNGTYQTIAGLYAFNAPCTINLDGPAGQTGRLTVVTLLHSQNYSYCELNGHSQVIVQGSGLQSFAHNSGTFAGTLEVQSTAASYLYSFNISGPYTVGANGAGGLEEATHAGAVQVDSGAWFIIESVQGAGTPLVSGPLVLTGSTTSLVLWLGTSSGPAGVVQGPISLGGVNLYACADTGYLPGAGDARVVLQNDAAINQAVQGTFAGLPEGGLLDLTECMSSSVHYSARISYRGGDGNDIAIQRLVRSTLTVAMVPSAPKFGDKVTLTAWMDVLDATTHSPAKTVDFYDNDHLLGSAALVNGYAVLTVDQLGVGSHQIQARYSGDPAYLDQRSNTLTFHTGIPLFLPLSRR